MTHDGSQFTLRLWVVLIVCEGFSRKFIVNMNLSAFLLLAVVFPITIVSFFILLEVFFLDFFFVKFSETFECNRM